MFIVWSWDSLNPQSTYDPEGAPGKRLPGSAPPLPPPCSWRGGGVWPCAPPTCPRRSPCILCYRPDERPPPTACLQSLPTPASPALTALLSLQNYFRDAWNVFDFVTVLGSITDILVTEIAVSSSPAPAGPAWSPHCASRPGG